MTQEQFEREKAYRIALSVATSMLKSGVITDEEYKKINVLMYEKFRPVQGCLGC